MPNAANTRMELLGARARHRTASRGTKMLRSKREALANELFRLMRTVINGRQRFDEALSAAASTLVIARALDGDAAIESLAAASGRDVPMEITERRVWGVPTPEITAPRLVRTSDARGTSPQSWSLTAAEAARRHEEALDLLFAVSSAELHLVRVGEEIRGTSRRINALEQLVLPRLAHEIARISLSLDEREREDAVRLKRFKARRAIANARSKDRSLERV